MHPPTLRQARGEIQISTKLLDCVTRPLICKVLARDHPRKISPVLNPNMGLAFSPVPREGGHVSQMTLILAPQGACSPCGIPGTTLSVKRKDWFLVLNVCVSSDMIHHKLSHINLFFEAIEKQVSSIAPPNHVLDMHHLEDWIFTLSSLCQASLCLTGSLAFELRLDRSSLA
ncbi:hypothetical protein BJX64DRAFT_94450 [Aspergillus heterothallicus]